MICSVSAPFRSQVAQTHHAARAVGQAPIRQPRCHSIGSPVIHSNLRPQRHLPQEPNSLTLLGSSSWRCASSTTTRSRCCRRVPLTSIMPTSRKRSAPSQAESGVVDDAGTHSAMYLQSEARCWLDFIVHPEANSAQAQRWILLCSGGSSRVVAALSPKARAKCSGLFQAPEAAQLHLKDGTVLTGKSFGAAAGMAGELVFTTGESSQPAACSSEARGSRAA